MGLNGRCVSDQGPVQICRCTFDVCVRDLDCHMGGPCACHGAPFNGQYGNTCVPGNCRTDSDCGAGGYCSPTRGSGNCGGLMGYYCHTAGDQCVDDQDCPSAGVGPSMCAWQDGAHRWECMPQLLCA